LWVSGSDRVRTVPHGLVGSGPRLMGRLGSDVWASASFAKNARLMGRLGSGPCLVADRADVVFTHALNFLGFVPFVHLQLSNDET